MVSVPSNVAVSEADGIVTVCANLTGSTAQNLTFTLETMDSDGQ